jgi:hypothetical protein
MTESMTGLMRRTMRPLAWVLVLALGVVLSAECVIGEEMTAAEHACCTAMAHDCESAGAQQDCCTTDDGAKPQLASAKQILVPTFDAAPLLFAAVPPASPLRNQRATRVSFAYAYVPTYLLGTAFLI